MAATIAHVYITRALSDRLAPSPPLYKYSPVFDMKQTAVVFEAKIRSAGSAIDPNGASCADNIQRGGRKTGEMKRGKKGREEIIRGGEEMKGRCSSVSLRRRGCQRSV